VVPVGATPVDVPMVEVGKALAHGRGRVPREVGVAL